ncbi:26S proteasome regulatory subunit p27-like protein [Elsinoe fawcettii]|nr:26S proteasome regulatory subunit p27-like protein [Elsinoe fawcettii]
MGLRMDDIHAPTVPSGPTTNGGSTIDQSRKSLFELMNERDRVQSELFTLGAVLESHNVDMQTPLLTPDGYPRADIDVAQIRTTRARIIRLKNDYKWLMEKIEKGLEEHHANFANAPPAERTSNGAATSAERTDSARPVGDIPGAAPTIEAPFAKVNSIARSSPAESAGLKVGDKVTKFGYVNWTNHDKLAKVAQVVQSNEGREITLKVLRAEEGTAASVTVELKLTPRHNWGGRGMLGCHLLPI